MARAAISALLSCAMLTVAGCGSEPPPAAAVARPVKLLRIGAAGTGEKIELSGTISAAQHSEMAFELAGKIIEFPVSEAQEVKKGDLLARIDPRDAQSDHDTQLARVRQARAEYERQKKLFEAQVSSQQELDRVQRAYEVALAQSEGSSKQLEDTELHAPFDGTVAKKLVKDFENVTAKQPVLILQDTSSLEIDVAVPEVDFAGMKPGLTLEQRTARSRPIVIVSSLPGRQFPARIKEFSTTADPVTRTFQATLGFDPPKDVVIRPGMTAKVVLTRGSDASSGAEGVSIPASAVFTDETGQPFVWVVDPEAMTVRRTPVELGELSGDRTAIRSGLSPGMQIAVSGVHQLQEGMEVRPYGG